MNSTLISKWSDVRGRLARVALIAVLMLLYTWLAVSSLVHLDLARDMRIALDIRAGIQYPLLGPTLASHVQLGSGWYYLLALLQVLGGGWLGAVVLLAAIASLQFPLAYLTGRAWAGRPAGLVWAVLLLVPSWSMFEQVTPTHTQLIGASVAAVLCCAFRYYRGGKLRYLIGMILAFSLALHAHPTALTLSAVPLLTVIHGWRRGRVSLGTLLLLAGVALIPFIPLLLDQWLHGLTMLGKVGAYLKSDNIEQTSIGNALPLAWQVSGGGMRYWLTGMIGLSPTIGWTASIFVAALIVAGLVATTLGATPGDKPSRIALPLLILALLLLVVMRGYFPYWMLTSLRVALMGAVAVGLARIGSGFGQAKATALLALLAAASIGSYVFAGASVFRWERAGNWPFAFLPVFDVKNIWQAQSPAAFMPARGIAASGRWLCATSPVAVHGPYAINLTHDYAQDARFACTSHDIVVGGNDPARQHWIGLSRDMLKTLGRGGQVEFGVFGLLPVRRVLGKPTTLADPTHRGFPPVAADSGPEQTISVPATLADHEYLALTHLGFAFVADPQWRVFAGTRELQPVAADATTRVYACKPCAGQALRIEIRSPSPGLTDIAVF